MGLTFNYNLAAADNSSIQIVPDQNGFMIFQMLDPSGNFLAQFQLNNSNANF